VIQTQIENFKFTYFKAIGILLVVLAHSGSGPSLQVSLETWFPIYAFHNPIPMFIFAAGYFYKETCSALEYAKKRVRRLLVPFYGWHLFYGIILTILTIAGITSFGKTITLQNFLIDPWRALDNLYSFNLASWFLIVLFSVQIIYMVIRKTLKIKNELLLAIGLLALGLVGTYISTVGLSVVFREEIARLLFCLPFIQFGYLYRLKLEKHDKPCLKSLILILAIQALLIGLFNSKFIFYFLVDRGQFNNAFLPFITSITGIWFWLQVCSYLSAKLGENRIISWLGNHTLEIMTHHLFGFWLLNTLFFALGMPNFNVSQYRTDIWYQYFINGYTYFLILYAIAGIMVSFAITKIASRVKLTLSKRLSSFAIPLINSKRATQPSRAEASCTDAP